MSSETNFPCLTSTGHVNTIKALIDMGAWLPPDKTWHMSSAVMFWLGHESLEGFLPDCTSREDLHQGLCAEAVRIRHSFHESRKDWGEDSD